MKSGITKNLLKGHTCDNCDSGFRIRLPCSANSYYPHDRTCLNWTDRPPYVARKLTPEEITYGLKVAQRLAKGDGH
jgi:hypothetical protein